MFKRNMCPITSLSNSNLTLISNRGFFSDSPLGILDTKLYDYKLGFDITLGMTKAERLLYGESLMTHAMVFSGVHLEAGRPVRWRVENSWGEEGGEKGYWVMSDDWFSEYVYQVGLWFNISIFCAYACFCKMTLNTLGTFS